MTPVRGRVGGIPEIIDDCNTGFLVERRDTAAMAGRILDLLRDPDLRRRMGEAGRRVVAEKFTHKTNVRQLIQLYGL
jgi:glycosyltransferase involved in cell wall biosynthesis